MSRHQRRYDDRRHYQPRSAKRGGAVPDRWLHYDAVGKDIEGTRFVPFKTPLHPHVFNNPNLYDDTFHVDILLQYAAEAGHSIGLVIDLTNTDRYYDKTQWEKHGVLYEKVRCPGHEVHEREDVVAKFFAIVDNYFNTRKDTSLIGVHCTHGLNRTGYLICRYLIERLGWSADQAIASFEDARGHPIERPQYKEKLHEVEARKKSSEKFEQVEQGDVGNCNVIDDKEEVKSNNSQAVPDL